MANQKDTAKVTSVDQAEKIINSYAYGDELDQAIEYLKANDPGNAALADITTDDIGLLKAMNALRAVDEARANDDSEELAKIAKVLNMSNNSALRKEALDIMRELGANEEQVSQVQAMIDETARLQHANEKHQQVQNNAPSMNDDDIVANADSIVSIFDDEDFKRFVWSETVEKSKDVSIVDDQGEKVENADDYWTTHNHWMHGDVLRTRMDDAAFASLDKKEKEATLKEDVISRFWSDVDQMETATAESSDDKKKKKTISANAFFSSFDNCRKNMADKVESLNAQGKKKADSWLSRKLNKLINFTRKIFGFTPVEAGKSLLGYFSSARGVTNTLAAGGMLAATTVSVPVALGAMVVYGTYMALSPSQWSIYEKKHANWKAAKASGDEAAIKAWSGRAGLKNAYNAIQANPKEKERFDRQKKINMWAGLGSAAVAGIAAPFAVMATTGTALGLGVKGTASAIRIGGAATNAGIQYKEAKRQYKEDQTEDSEIGMTQARTYFGATVLLGALAEAFAVWNLANAFTSSNAMEATSNPEQVDSLANSKDSLVVKPIAEQNDSISGGEKVDVDGSNTNDAPTSETTNVAVPDKWNADMGISENQWNNMIHKDGLEGFQEKYMNVYNAQQENPNMFVRADGTPMTTVEAVHHSERILEYYGIKEKTSDVNAFFDENSKLVTKTDNGFVYADTKEPVTSQDIAPQCTDPKYVETYRAIYKIVNCGQDVKTLDTNQFNELYSGVKSGGAAVYADVNKCGELHWVRVARHALHTVRKAIEPVVEQPAEISDATPVDANISQPATITDVKLPDADVNDGITVSTNVTSTESTTFSSQLGDDDKSIAATKVVGTKVIPGSVVNIGRDLGGR